jgi:methylenetetrahydrofolate reductase (NADPH)
MVRRLRGVPADRVADEGMQICVEIIQRLTAISGVAGAHVMAFGYEQGIPEILERAGVGPRPGRAAVNDRAANEGSGRAG